MALIMQVKELEIAKSEVGETLRVTTEEKESLEKRIEELNLVLINQVKELEEEIASLKVNGQRLEQEKDELRDSIVREKSAEMEVLTGKLREEQEMLVKRLEELEESAKKEEASFKVFFLLNS